MPGREAQTLHEPALGVIDLRAEMRRNDRPFAAVAVSVDERRVGDRHLQRIGLQFALPDGEVHVVADPPRRYFGDDPAGGDVAPVLALQLERVLFGAPRRVRDDARDLARQVDAGLLAEAQLVRHVLDHFAAVVECQLADFEEVGVRGDLQRFDEAHGAVVGVAGVAELLGGDVDALTRAESFFGRDDAVFERRHRGDRLERRARRIGAVHRSVGQASADRPAADQGVVFGLRERFGELVGVERRIGADREDFAVARVERHERACVRGFAPGPRVFDPFEQRLFALPLQTEVERDLQAVSRHRRLRREPARHRIARALTSTRCTPASPRR